METLVPDAVESAQRADTAAVTSALTPGQRWLLQQLARGCTNAEMALMLGRSEKTVRNRLTMLYARLGVRNRAGAVGVWGNGMGLRLG